MVTSAATDVPSGIHGVTPQWLSTVLGGRVTELRAEQIALDTGFSSWLYRVHLTGESVPDSVIVKLPAQSQAGQAMGMMGGYAREVAFYRDVAGRAPIGTPQVYVAAMADNSADFVLVLEDMAHWDNADHLAGLSLDRARLAIAQLAGLHAWSTAKEHSAHLQAFPGIDTPVTHDMLPAAFELGWAVYQEKSRTPIPAAVAEYASRFKDLAPRAIEALSDRRMLLHGDIRADNMFFSGEQLKVVDFQMSAWGGGALDIGYLVSQGMPTEARSGCDEMLVREYLGVLRANGVEDYSFEEAWRHYRFAVAYYVVLPTMPLLSWDTLPDRSRRLCMRLVERAVTAIDEIKAMEVFT